MGVASRTTMPAESNTPAGRDIAGTRDNARPAARQTVAVTTPTSNTRPIMRSRPSSFFILRTPPQKHQHGHDEEHGGHQPFQPTHRYASAKPDGGARADLHPNHGRGGP